MTVQSRWTHDGLVEAFEQQLRQVCGVSEHTIRGYSRYARQFLGAACTDRPMDLAGVGPSDVIDFISAATARYRPRTVKLVATALRSFFRFVRVQGVCNTRLGEAGPTAAAWRLSTLPRSLSEEQLRCLLASLDGTSPRRPYVRQR